MAVYRRKRVAILGTSATTVPDGQRQITKSATQSLRTMNFATNAKRRKKAESASKVLDIPNLVTLSYLKRGSTAGC